LCIADSRSETSCVSLAIARDATRPCVEKLGDEFEVVGRLADALDHELELLPPRAHDAVLNEQPRHRNARRNDLVPRQQHQGDRDGGERAEHQRQQPRESD
jgi:hypothetical protein